LEDSACMSHKTRLFYTHFVTFSTLNASAIAMTSVTVSLQSHFLLVDCREKSARLSFPKFRCFRLALNLFSTKKLETCWRTARSIWTCPDRSITSPTCLRKCLSRTCPSLACNLLKTCLRSDWRCVLSRFKAGCWQDRCSVIWA